jgi:hypothetical protein
MASEKTVNRTVAGVLLVVFLILFPLIAKEVIMDILEMGVLSPRAIFLSIMSFAGLVAVYMAVRALVRDLMTGGVPGSSK